VKELVEKIDQYVQNSNCHPHPFVWTATADSIFTKVQRLYETYFWDRTLAYKKTSNPIAFTHVTVIDATGARPKNDMTVVVSEGKITAIGQTASVAVPS
jgi:hypothetical protein